MILYKQYVQGVDGLLHLARGMEYFAPKSERYSWTTEWRGQGGGAYAYESAMLKLEKEKSVKNKKVNNKKKGGK